MCKKKITLDDIFNNPGDRKLIDKFNKQLEEDMREVYEESARIEKQLNIEKNTNKDS